MAMPKKRMSQTRTGTRRSQISLLMPVLIACKQCGAPKLLHSTCIICGTYRGRAIIDVEKPLRKRRAKADAEQEAAQTPAV